MVDNLTSMMEVLTGWVAILMPVLLIWVIFYFATKMDKAKYEPIDYRRTGVITIFVGLGLFLFGLVSISILKGVGLLVICIGVGSLVAGYIYPNNSHEIAEAVEKFEKK